MNVVKIRCMAVCFLITALFSVNAYSQDANPKKSDEKTLSSSSAVNKDTISPVEIKDTALEKGKASPEQKKEKPGDTAGNDPGSGLLFFRDGDYKYTRIPGYKPDSGEKGNGNEIVRIPGPVGTVKEESTIDTEGKGLFGFSRQSTNYIAKGSILLLIIVIFVLYRFRSKKSNSGVLRSLPKK